MTKNYGTVINGKSKNEDCIGIENTGFKKIEKSMARDRKANDDLIELGWMPLRFFAKDVLKDMYKYVAEIKSLCEAE